MWDLALGTLRLDIAFGIFRLGFRVWDLAFAFRILRVVGSCVQGS